jgi:hypothetical protein
MSVSPQAALADQPVAVRVQGLPAGARTTLTATARDTDGIRWSATAQFRATPAGEVSLGQPSLGGSYSGVNPMGLFTLMAPPPGSSPDWFLYPAAGYDITLEASAGGRVAATATVRRQGPLVLGVAERRLRPAKGGIHANLYLPEHTAGRRPAVLVFGGSGGGLTTSRRRRCWPPTATRAWPWRTSRRRACPRACTTSPWSTSPAPSGCCGPSPGWTPAMSWSPGSRGAARPRCCSAPTSPSWSTGSSPGCPARRCTRAGPTPPSRPGPWTAPPPGPQRDRARAAHPAREGPGGHPRRAHPRPDPAHLWPAGRGLAVLRLCRRHHRPPARPRLGGSGDRVALSRRRSPRRRPHRLLRQPDRGRPHLLWRHPWKAPRPPKPTPTPTCSPSSHPRSDRRVRSRRGNR